MEHGCGSALQSAVFQVVSWIIGTAGAGHGGSYMRGGDAARVPARGWGG